MSNRKIRSRVGFSTACIGLLLALAGCGSDSTGPGSLDAKGALQSLALGFGGLVDPGSPASPLTDGSLGELAPLLDHVDVTIGGTSRSMFALGLLETFPAGTCEENLFPDPGFPPPAGVCTPPSLAHLLVLWQSHAANAPPDRLLVIGSDIGTSNFDFLSLNGVPGVAFYLEGLNSEWISASGSLTSAVTAAGLTCSLPLAPYAKSATCHIASFDEQGEITFESLSDNPVTPPPLKVTIPRQSLHGIWVEITETKPIA
jgi:hypothetical protein